MEIKNIINPLLDSTGEDVMGFLNEIQLNYPAAVSLASGRPDENYFNLDGLAADFDLYIDTVSKQENKSREKVMKDLGQYARTRGIANELVAKYLEKDLGIYAAPEHIITTVGSQEGMAMAVLTLCDREKDVILVEDPTYVGITHFALIAGCSVEPVPVNTDGICLRSLEEKIIHVKEQGKNVKIVYVIPDYQNPTGCSMPAENREKLLALANEYDFFIVEDNAYGEFIYDSPGHIPIKAIDKNKRVIYLHSFSKILYPSLRLSVMVADSEIILKEKKTPLSELMAKTKGYITVNTSALSQAVLGGILIRNKFSLKKMNEEKVQSLKHKRDLLIKALEHFFGNDKSEWMQKVSWNKPRGGFFMAVNVPFKAGKEDVIECAEKYGLIFTPMSFFYHGKGGEQTIRLAFSNIDNSQIEQAIEQLAAFIKSKMNTHN